MKKRKIRTKKIKKEFKYICNNEIYKGVTCEMLYSYTRLTQKFKQCSKCNAMYGTTFNKSKYYRIKIVGKTFFNLNNIIKVEVFNNV